MTARLPLPHKGPRRWAFAAGAVLLVLASCQSTAPAQRSSLAGLPTGPDPASATVQQVADALLGADAAFARQDMQDLNRRLAILLPRAPRALEAREDDMLARWQAAAGTPVSAPMRGRAIGPGFVDGMLEPTAARTFTQVLLSGQPTQIAVSAAPARFVNLQVFDGDDRLLCERTVVSGGGCRVTPLFTQRFRIEVSNRGKARARYFLVID